jgi:hypothetical protein
VKKITVTAILTNDPPKKLQDSQAEIQDTEAIDLEAIFYRASTDSVDLCPKAEP